MKSKKKTRRIVSIVLGLLFFALPMADACMLEHLSLGGMPMADHSAMPCQTLPAPETAQRLCNLSDQHRALQSPEQPFAPALLCEDGLTLIANSLKAATGDAKRLEAPQIDSHRGKDLFIVHRSLLI